MSVPRRAEPLRRLRLSLTAWYVATFAGILLVLGGWLFLEIRHRYGVALDRSLRDATAALEQSARIRAEESGDVSEDTDQLRIPDRTLFLFRGDGRPVNPPPPDAWITAAAATAATAGRVDLDHRTPHAHPMRLHAERFTLDDGTVLVAVAVADRVELEERYAELIATFSAAALGALVLVAAGSWLLVRKSTAPIERNITQMRRFMADAAHELRTPLTVLRSRAEVALQQPRDGAGYVDALRGIDAESQRLGRIVGDLLTLARADAGERPIEQRRVYLDDVANDAASAAGVVAQANGVTLTMDRFEEASVTGDPELLRQLVMILLDNAIKFTPQGGRVRISVGAQSDAATLVVDDTGCGIPAEQLPHIFERFYRGDPARTRGESGAHDHTGAGLGLAIARWIATAHHATITVDSVPERGTTVTVRFARGPAQRARTA